MPSNYLHLTKYCECPVQLFSNSHISFKFFLLLFMFTSVLFCSTTLQKRKRFLFVYYCRKKKAVFFVNMRVIPVWGSEIALFYGCDFYYIHLYNCRNLIAIFIKPTGQCGGVTVMINETQTMLWTLFFSVRWFQLKSMQVTWRLHCVYFILILEVNLFEPQLTLPVTIYGGLLYSLLFVCFVWNHL